ncbi:formate/nitrite transporter family protein [Deinococcus radiotolerans]|uniref:Formate transporter FocA n=1 Tax=Deinococcus radiotolerans TaxID=1309407 RepID=A0ABQ2FL27_9DEIO|nr:formate/nitrite transporter family protein [Deinococcus radiotolerans]GGL00177.1 formate transporter FocA [Deinococcus radiotolerans]
MTSAPPPDPTVLSGAALTRAVVNKEVEKAERAAWPTFILAILAGMFIGLGGMFYTLIEAGGIDFAFKQALGGLGFCVGLVLVLVAGAELLTGNVLLVLAAVRRRVTWAQVARNWALVLTGNLVGGVLLALLVVASGHPNLDGGGVAQQAVTIAAGKVAKTPAQLLFSGALCNMLVCLAVWMAFAGKTLADKILAVLLPVTAFVAAGFEHSVADMYLLPLGLLLQGSVPAVPGSSLDAAHVAVTLVLVTAGNIVGGAVFVALAYHFAYPDEPARA